MLNPILTAIVIVIIALLVYVVFAWTSKDDDWRISSKILAVESSRDPSMRYEVDTMVRIDNNIDTLIRTIKKTPQGEVRDIIRRKYIIVDDITTTPNISNRLIETIGYIDLK